MMRRPILAALVLFLHFAAGGFRSVIGQTESAIQVDGAWQLWANGYEFAVDIHQQEAAITGELRPANHGGPQSLLSGTVDSGGRVIFDRDGQKFRGRVFIGREPGRYMAGLFNSGGGVNNECGWYARRR